MPKRAPVCRNKYSYSLRLVVRRLVSCPDATSDLSEDFGELFVARLLYEFERRLDSRFARYRRIAACRRLFVAFVVLFFIRQLDLLRTSI